jgi:hypothetical protein
MTDRSVETSPQLYARIGGLLYLIIIVLGLFDEAFVRNRIIVSADAAATAANLRSFESLWRFGIAAEFFLLICAISLTLIFFVLAAGQQGYRFAGGIFHFGIVGNRSGGSAISAWGIVSAGQG